MSAPNAEQAKRNAFKAVRTAIRLKHAINADNELAVVLPEVEKRFKDAELKGRHLPEPSDFLGMLKL